MRPSQRRASLPPVSASPLPAGARRSTPPTTPTGVQSPMAPPRSPPGVVQLRSTAVGGTLLDLEGLCQLQVGVRNRGSARRRCSQRATVCRRCRCLAPWHGAPSSIVMDPGSGTPAVSQILGLPPGPGLPHRTVAAPRATPSAAAASGAPAASTGAAVTTTRSPAPLPARPLRRTQLQQPRLTLRAAQVHTTVRELRCKVADCNPCCINAVSICVYRLASCAQPEWVPCN